LVQGERILRLLSRIFGGFVLFATLIFGGITSSFAAETQCKEEGMIYYEAAGECCYAFYEGTCIKDFKDWQTLVTNNRCTAAFINSKDGVECCDNGDEYYHCTCNKGMTWYDEMPGCCYYFDPNDSGSCITDTDEWINFLKKATGCTAGYIDMNNEPQCCPKGTHDNDDNSCSCDDENMTFNPQIGQCVTGKSGSSGMSCKDGMTYYEEAGDCCYIFFDGQCISDFEEWKNMVQQYNCEGGGLFINGKDPDCCDNGDEYYHCICDEGMTWYDEMPGCCYFYNPDKGISCIEDPGEWSQFLINEIGCDAGYIDINNQPQCCPDGTSANDVFGCKCDDDNMTFNPQTGQCEEGGSGGEECDPGYFWDGNTCKICADGYTCSGGTSAPVPNIYMIKLRNYNNTSTHQTIYEKFATDWYSDPSATSAIPAADIPTRSGYTFRGYYTTQQSDLTATGGSGTRRITNLTSNLPSSSTFTADTTLYAAWAKNCTTPSNGSCSLTINGNGTATYTTSCNSGYTIIGNGTATPTCTATGGGSSNCYRIDFNNTANGGTGGAPTSVYMYRDATTYSASQNQSKWCKLYTDSACTTEVANNNNSYTIPTTNPTKSHATFKHYVSNSADEYFIPSRVELNGTGNIRAWYSCAYPNDTNYGINSLGFNASQTPSLTFNAVYSCNEGWRGSCTMTYNNNCVSSTACTASPTSTISFNANGGSGGRSGTVTATYGSMVPVITTSNWTTPHRFGYNFGGYVDTQNTLYYGSTGSPIKAWDKTTNTTLNAQWNLFSDDKLNFYNTDSTLNSYQVYCTRTSCANLPTYSAAGLTAPSGGTFKGWAFLCGDYQYCGAGDATDTGLYAAGTNVTASNVVNNFFGRWNEDKNNSSFNSGLRACWQFNISYELNGGTNPGSVPTTYNNCQNTTLPTPTRDNYVFGGWYENSSFTGNPVTTIAGGSTGAKTYYAKWTESTCWHTVLNNTTYGGTGGTTDIYINKSTCNVYANAGCTGSAITALPSTPTKANAGYTGHYNPAESGWGALITTSGSDRFTNLKTECNGNRFYSTLVAKYTCSDGYHAASSATNAACVANTYSVHFNNANCPTTPSGSMSNQDFTYGTAQNLTSNGFSCVGYTFTGWATSSNGSVAYSNGQSVNNLTTTNGGTVELYTKWSAGNVTCSAGEYLPANSATCETCPVGFYCPSAGTYTVSGVPQGRTPCPTGYDDGTMTGKTLESQCQISCGKGERVATANAQCSTPSGGWFSTDITLTNYGEVTPVIYCMKGYTNLGTNPSDHDMVKDCQASIPAGYMVESNMFVRAAAIKIINSSSRPLNIVELQAFNNNNVNRLAGVTGSGNGVSNPAKATDNVFTPSAYTTIAAGQAGLWVINGQDKLKSLQFALAPGRYENIAIEIDDGTNTNWVTVFSGDIEHTKQVVNARGETIFLTNPATTCPGGQFSTTSTVLLGNTSTCTNVNAGYYTTGGGTSATPTATGNGCLSGFSCGLITAGYYGSAGATSSSGNGKCAVGSWSSAGSSSCTACTAGTTTANTGSTSSSACTACSNSSHVSTWKTPVSWSANSVSNLCVINTCATGYNKTGSSPYQCTAGTYTISLDSDFYSSATATTPLAVNTAASPASIKEHYGIGWLKADGTTAFTALDTLPAYGNRLFYGFWTGKTGTGTKIINSDGSLADTTATVFSSNSTAYAKWSAANVCECTKGTHVESCSSTGVTDNKCQYSFNCATGYTIDGSATSGTFEGSVGVSSNESPACSSAGNYSITYVLNGGLNVALATYTPVEYVSSKSANSAFSYFDTGTKFDFGKDFRVVGKFSNPNTSARHILLGSYTSADNVFNIELKTSPTGAFRTYFASGADGNTSQAIAANTWTAYDVFYDPISRKSKTIAGTQNFTLSVPNGTGEVAKDMRMFLDHRTSTSAIAYPVKMAATAIYKNNALVNYYVPVRNSSNVCGMYDAKNNSFKASATAAAFDCPSTTTMPTSFAYDTGATISGVPVRAHSQFAGWCTNSALTQGCAMTKTIAANSTNSAQTFYAKWTCDAGYHLSGNACVANSITLSWTTAHGTAPSSPSSCSYGGTFTAPAAISATGYTFGGWNINGNTVAAGTTVSCNEISLGTNTNNASVSGSAIWTTNTYTVNYNFANGYMPVDYIVSDGTNFIQTDVYNDLNKDFMIKGKLYRNSKSGLKRVFSNYDSLPVLAMQIQNNGKVRAFIGPVSGSVITSTTALALNSPVPYTLTYDKTQRSATFSLNGETLSLSNIPAYSNASAAPLRFFLDYGDPTPIARPVVAANTSITQDNILVANFIPARKIAGSCGLFDTVRSKFYTNTQGMNPFTCPDQISTLPVSYTYGVGATISGTPLREGYTFAGWTGANGNTAQTTVTIGTTASGNKTYTANWVPNQYTISYDLDGGAWGSTPHVETYNIETATFAVGNPTKLGYTFNGWTIITAPTAWGTGSSSDGAINFNIGRGTYGNIVMKANWTLNTCDPGLYMDNGSCVACPENHYCVGGTTTAQACPANLYTPNNTIAAYHDEAGDCGRKLHIGTDVLWLRSDKKSMNSANKALNFDFFNNDGVADLFLNLSTNPSPMSSTTNKNFKMNVGGTVYYGCDDGTCQ
jgi:uncharacterized repeat protein (TIGR02543 family)